LRTEFLEISLLHAGPRGNAHTHTIVVVVVVVAVVAAVVVVVVVVVVSFSRVSKSGGKQKNATEEGEGGAEGSGCVRRARTARDEASLKGP